LTSGKQQIENVFSSVIESCNNGNCVSCISKGNFEINMATAPCNPKLSKNELYPY